MSSAAGVGLLVVVTARQSMGGLQALGADR